MYVTNLDEVVPILRGRLRDYLGLKLGDIPEGKKKFRCFVHDDRGTPNMCFNPKSGDETVHCFSCGATLDIFAAANHLESLPSNGPEWVTETIPHLCELLEIKLAMGEPTLHDQEKAKLYRLAQDISDILVQAGDPTGYAAKRNWEQEDLAMGSVSEETLVSKLTEKGWNTEDIARSLMVRTNAQSFFGDDKLTFALKDERGRPVGFMYRNLGDRGPKYVNTPETLVYQKGKLLVGLDTAIQDAKRHGLYIVEGLGDLAQLKRLGIKNSAATCGTALTADHLLNLKQLGVRTIIMALDWDDAGQVATSRIFFDVLKEVQGITVHVLDKPSTPVKDLDELLSDKSDAKAFLDLRRVTAFEWVLERLSDNETPDGVCAKMIPLIAAEPAAVRRELLMKKLAQHTGLTYTSILSDVNAIRGGKFEERKERLLAAADQYRKEVEEDPENILAIMSQHEERISRIEKEYNRDIIGVNYQLQRYDAIQQMRQEANEGSTGFVMKWMPGYAKAMSGGMPWSTGCLTYVGGRANSGKTATCIAIGADVAMHDPDAMVIYHFTDDSYEQVEPRIKSNIARMLFPIYPRLSIGQIVNPKTGLVSFGDEYWKALETADEALKTLLSEEHLVIIDSEDGSTMSTLEKQVRYYRQRYPSRKLLLVCDNTHNYMDFLHLEQTQRMTQISNLQKAMTAKYHCSMIATAEYRKNIPRDTSKMVLPVDDDLADARALMYRPNVIFHVYNDLHDRKEHAEIMHIGDSGKAEPRLLLHFTKNKISSFKDKLVVDLDPKSVTLKEYDADAANQEAYEFHNEKAEGKVSLQGSQVVYVDAEEYDEEAERHETSGPPW